LDGDRKKNPDRGVLQINLDPRGEKKNGSTTEAVGWTIPEGRWDQPADEEQEKGVGGEMSRGGGGKGTSRVSLKKREKHKKGREKKKRLTAPTKGKAEH